MSQDDDDSDGASCTHVCASCKREVKHEQRFYPHAHGKECRQPEIRLRRAEWEIEELRTSLLALARHLLTPGECLAPDAPMYCGSSDLCPCRTDGEFHGTCGINETLVSLLQADILEQRKRGVALPWWARVEAKETHGISEAIPDTQRSGSTVPDPERERRIRCHGDAGVCSYCPITQDSGEPHADARAAEPERAPTAGPDARYPVRRDT